MTCCGDLVRHARQPPPSRWVGGSGTVKEVMRMDFWTKMVKSPSLPGIILAVVVTVLEAALDDE